MEGRPRRDFRSPVVALLLPLALHACASLDPADAAPAAPLRADPAIARHFPGAAALADGIDRAGERALRDGDRIVVGIEVLAGGPVERHLLEVIVHRGTLEDSTGVLTFTGEGSAAMGLPRRFSRRLDLELVLRTPDGVEVRRSRIDQVPEFIVDESFVAAIRRSRQESERATVIASVRLVHIVNMLQQDPILQSMLARAATVPLDITLLWRRELMMEAYFDRAVEAPSSEGPALARFELPFDLFLNGSLLIRLVATVTDPHGPSGAIGGIVGLLAQDARNPEHQLRVHLLGARRGPVSEWRRDGVLASYGYGNEGAGLAFSPDQRFVAMPGAEDDVVVHDLHATDEAHAPAERADCAGTVEDLAFLDERTLLVASGGHVEVFDVDDAGALRRVAAHEAERTLCALEVVDPSTVFVGRYGYGVERWSFAADRRAAPRREVVQDAVEERLEVTTDLPGGATATMKRRPSPGFVYAVSAERVLVRGRNDEVERRRAPDGAWTRVEIERVDAPTSRRRRLPGAPETPMFDLVAKGDSLVRCDEAGVHAWAAGPVSLTGERTRILNSTRAMGAPCHGFTSDGRYYACVVPGYRVLVDVARFLRR